MGKSFATLLPFVIAGILVLGALIGPHLSVARRRAASRGLMIGLTAGAAGMLLWLLLWNRNPAFRSLVFLLPVFLVVMLTRYFPRARRAVVALGGGLLIAYSFVVSHLLFAIFDEAGFLVFRWAMVFCGVMMIVAAWGNWLPSDQPEDEAPLRPATGRVPRHFGGAS